MVVLSFFGSQESQERQPGQEDPMLESVEDTHQALLTVVEHPAEIAGVITTEWFSFCSPPPNIPLFIIVMFLKNSNCFKNKYGFYLLATCRVRVGMRVGFVWVCKSE